MNRAVFLDRDGVIIQEPPHYIYKPDQLNFIHGSIDAIKLLNKNDFKVIVVTNQAGVAKGYYLEKDVISFNQLMKEELELYDGKIDDIYYCPHHKDAKVKKYKIDCNCRKPNPGMLKMAGEKFNIDFNMSYMIGDRKSDIDAGNMVGCKSILVSTGYGTEESKRHNLDMTKDLYDAVINILNCRDI